MRVRFFSTMLPTTAEVIFETDDLDRDEINDQLTACEVLFNAHGPKAEFRYELVDEDGDTFDDIQWMIGHMRAATSSLVNPVEQLKVLVEFPEWDDKHQVMAAYYVRRHSEAARVVSAVDNEEWMIEYADNEADAYRAYARGKLDHDYNGLDSDLHDYFDFERFGRDRADGCIHYHDGDYYVFDEWD